MIKKYKSIIGLSVPNLERYFWASIVQSVKETAHKHGYQTLLAITGYNSKKEISQLRKLLKTGLKGIILQPLPGEESINCYLELKEKVPLVFIDRDLERVKTDYVVPDPQKGAYKVVKHLIGMGHRRIGYIGDNLKRYRYFDQMRLKGYQRALEEAGIKFDKELVIETKGNAPDVGYRAMKRFMKLKPAPTAVFAFVDRVAVGALAAVKETGKIVPKDIALAGYDDSPLALSVNPPLTSVALPRERMGKEAVEVLLKKLGQGGKGRPYRIILEPKLIVRESSLTLPGPEKRDCRICGKPFRLFRKNPRQTVCSHPACQKLRQKENERQWRERYADHFAESAGLSPWCQYRLEKLKEWRQKHIEYLKRYRRIHQERQREYMRGYRKKENYRNYMREYMRKYREKAEKVV